MGTRTEAGENSSRLSYLAEILEGLFSISTVVVSDSLKQVESQKQHLLLATVSLKLLGKKDKAVLLLQVHSGHICNSLCHTEQMVVLKCSQCHY